MNKALRIAFASLVSFTAFAFTYQSYLNWKIDNEKAMVKFTLQANGEELIGNFKGASGDVAFDENNPANTSISCTIDVSTINTGIEGRDKHLQAKGFFDVANYPQARFSSYKVEKPDAGYWVSGKLHLKDTTMDVYFPMQFTGSGDKGVFTGSFNIKRSDFHIGDPDRDIADEVKISFNIPVSKVN